MRSALVIVCKFLIFAASNRQSQTNNKWLRTTRDIVQNTMYTIPHESIRETTFIRIADFPNAAKAMVEDLMERLHMTREEAIRESRRPVEVAVCYEKGFGILVHDYSEIGFGNPVFSPYTGNEFGYEAQDITACEQVKPDGTPSLLESYKRTLWCIVRSGYFVSGVSPYSFGLHLSDALLYKSAEEAAESARALSEVQGDEHDVFPVRDGMRG